jgi:hypothetical protein
MTPSGKRQMAEDAEKRRLEQERLAEEQERIAEQRVANEKRISEQRFAEKKRIEAEEKRIEDERIYHRDADSQESPYTYECVGHPNATLAIRYGIANLKKEIKEYWYKGKGGVKQRNPDRDTSSLVPAVTIQLQKVRKVKDDPEGSHYLAKLVDFGNREVIVVIKPGTEYVQTFYPKSEDWFKKYADLELVLKDNKTFELKELANFHVQKVVINS